MSVNVPTPTSDRSAAPDHAELAVWMDEVRAEADSLPSRPMAVLVIKRRGMRADRACDVLELHDFARLIEEENP